MKFQIAFDMSDLNRALDIAAAVAEFADVLEVGTLLIYRNGTYAIHRFKESFPNKLIVADSKIVDRSKEAITLLADAQADYMTVMAGTSKNVIHAACTTAADLNKRIMLDLLDSASVGQSALEAKNLGVNAILFHQSAQESEALIFLDKWEMVRGNTDLPIFVSGRIKRETIGDFVAVKPDGIIIGKSIVESADPRQEAQFFYDYIKQNSRD